MVERMREKKKGKIASLRPAGKDLAFSREEGEKGS